MTQEQIVAALVNPLAWIPYETDDGTRGVHADATFGKYLCVPSGWFLVGQTGWMDETDLAAAQAAAEADYRSRIAAAMDVGKIAALVEALEDIGKQKKSDEFAYEQFRDEADFAGGYDEGVTRARATLAKLRAHLEDKP